MGIVLETSTTARIGAADTSVVVTKPSGTVSGDVLVVFICSSGNSLTYSAPGGGGWVTIVNYAPGNNRCQAMFYLVAGGSEPASYTFTISSSQGNRVYWCGRFSGVDNADPEDATNTTNTGLNSDTPVGLSITTGNANAFIVESIRSNASSISQSASDLAEISDTDEDYWINGEVQTAAGASGNKNSTLDELTHWSTIMWALKEAGGPTGPQVNISPNANYIQIV